MFEIIFFFVFLALLVLGTIWIVLRAVLAHDGTFSEEYLSHHSAILYPIINFRKRITQPCYECKHCVYKEDEYIRYSNKKLQPYCDKKSAVNYYERLANEHSGVVNSDYIRGTKYCEFKKNKNQD